MNTLEIQTTLQELIDRTRESLGDLEEEERIPRVDLFDVLPDFWDEWFNPILQVWNPEVRREVREFLLQETRSHPADVAIRWAGLAILSGLIEYLTSWKHFEKPYPPSIRPFQGLPEVNEVASGHTGQRRIVNPKISFWTDHAALLQEDLLCILHDVAIENITDCRMLSWEISNAGLAEDWGRMFSLFQRAQELGIVSKADVHLLRAQFQYFLAFRSILDEHWRRMFHGSDLSVRRNPLHPKKWDAIEHRFRDGDSSRFLLASGLSVDAAKPDDAEPDPGLLLDALKALESARKLQGLPASHQAALARCYFAARRFQDAAIAYDELLRSEFREAWLPLLPQVYRATATSYECGGNAEKAISVLQSCSDRFPKEADVYDKTAELQARAADYAALQDTLRKKFENIPSADKDWRISAFLAVSEVQRSDLRSGETACPIDPAIYDGIVGCLTYYWRPFPHLSAKTKRLWVRGTYLRRFVPEQHGMSEELSLSVLNSLLKALDIELGLRVFHRLREHFWRTKELTQKVERERMPTSLPKDKNLEILCNFVQNEKRNLEIGKKASLLLACRAPSHDLLKAMRKWFEEYFPALLAKSGELERVAKFRNIAEHEDRVVEPIESVYRSCHSLIECIFEKSDTQPPAAVRPQP